MGPRILVALLISAILCVLAKEPIPLPVVEDAQDLSTTVSIPLTPNTRPNLDLSLIATRLDSFYGPHILHHYLLAVRNFWLEVNNNAIQRLTLNDPWYRTQYLHYACIPFIPQKFDSRDALWATLAIIDRGLETFRSSQDYSWLTEAWILKIDGLENAYIWINNDPSIAENDLEDFASAKPQVVRPGTEVQKRSHQKLQSFRVRSKRQTNDFDRLRTNFTSTATPGSNTFYPRTILKIFRDFAANLMGHSASDPVSKHYTFNQPYTLTEFAPGSPPQPFPFILTGVSGIFTFFPADEGSAESEVEVTVQEAVECLLEILRLMGEDEINRLGFRAYESVCGRDQEFGGPILKMEAIANPLIPPHVDSI